MIVVQALGWGNVSQPMFALAARACATPASGYFGTFTLT